MRLRPLPFLVAVLPLAACGPDSGLRALPNSAPIAIAAISTGEVLDEASARFVGYTVLGGSAELDATLSRDTDGQIATRTWAFDSLPEGSTLTAESIVVPEDDPATEDRDESQFASFTPDVYGTFRVSLIVTDNDDESSEMVFVFVQAVPPSGLEFEITWPDSGADLDVHVTRPGGTYFDYLGGSDCFSWNPNPDWGDSNLALDNPELGTDEDGVGAGPFRESIYVDTPTATAADGGYLVRVHYYADHVALAGGSALPAVPTLRIKVLGEVVSELTPASPLTSGDVWVVGELSWPAQDFVQIGTMTTHATLGGPPYNL